MNIFEKLIELRKTTSYLQKTEHGQKGVSSSATLAKIRPKMDELGLLLVPNITKTNTFPKRDYGKKESIELFTEIWLTYTWINAESPKETIVCEFYGQGLDTGEKGIGKALTYSEKYFFLKFLNIPTDKLDPDTFKSNNEPPVDYMTPIQRQAINKKCIDAGLAKEGIAAFARLYELSAKTTKKEANDLLEVIDEKIKQFLDN